MVIILLALYTCQSARSSWHLAQPSLLLHSAAQEVSGMKRVGGTILSLFAWTTLAAAGGIDESKVIDLTYSFDEHTIFWPTFKPFQLEIVSATKTEAGYWYAANNICLAEHGGTHMDAPLHFAEGKRA